MNPGAFTHYAWSLHDALASFGDPIIELHISNPDGRESWRRTSVVTPVATGHIAGFGGVGYRLALEAMAELLADTQLPPMDVAGRVTRLRACFEEAGCDALLVTNLVNVRYLTGFTGSAATLLVEPDGLLFVTDGRYGPSAGGAGRRAWRHGSRSSGAAPRREVVSKAAPVPPAWSWRPITSPGLASGRSPPTGSPAAS